MGYSKKDLAINGGPRAKKDPQPAHSRRRRVRLFSQLIAGRYL
jgi:hypothetical protein